MDCICYTCFHFISANEKYNGLPKSINFLGAFLWKIYWHILLLSSNVLIYFPKSDIHYYSVCVYINTYIFCYPYRFYINIYVISIYFLVRCVHRICKKRRNEIMSSLYYVIPFESMLIEFVYVYRKVRPENLCVFL